MRSFAYGIESGISKLPEDIMLLFTDMLTDKKPVDCVDEIITAALAGKINLNKSFNLRGYEYKVHENQKLVQAKKDKNNKYIDDTDSANDDYSDVRRTGGITASEASANAINKMKDAYDEVCDDAELKYAIETIKEINEDMIVEDGVDLIRLVKNALTGIPQAVKSLKDVCEEHSLVKEYVYIILNSGKDVAELL